MSETPPAQEAGGERPLPDPAPAGSGAAVAPGQMNHGAGAGRPDRWAHRRGEPRLFVVLWTTYLFCATLLALGAVSGASVLSADMYRPAARVLLASVAAGVALLWPMVRLSQSMPARGGAWTAAQDYLIVMLPAQAVIWPQWSLAALPGGVVAALAANMAAWGLLVAGLLANALTAAPGSASGARRAAWMGVFILIASGGAAVALVQWAGSVRDPAPAMRTAWMLSPITSVFELLADRSWMGAAAVVTRGHWAASGLVGAAGLMAWFVARWRSVALGRRLPTGLH